MSKSKKSVSKKSVDTKKSTKKSKDTTFNTLEEAVNHFKTLEANGQDPTEEEYNQYVDRAKKEHDHQNDLFHKIFGKSKKGDAFHGDEEPPPKDAEGKKRSNWKNQSATQVVNPLRLFAPDSLDDLVIILEDAVHHDLTVRAVGSGHSYSDCVAVDDYLVTTFGFNKFSSHDNPLSGQLSQDMLLGDVKLAMGNEPVTWDSYDPENNTCLLEIEAGVRLRHLTAQLEPLGLALPNMGGFDGQTIAGVTSTATHGSGVGITCLSDIIKSLVIVTTGRWSRSHTDTVNIYRIEPSNGITDPKKWDNPNGIKLIQSDDCFYSTICSMGCFGIIYSVTIELMQEYYLEETRTMSTLDKVIEDLQPNPNNAGHLPDVLLNHRHYEVLIHPYAMHGEKVLEIDINNPSASYPNIAVLITQRNIAPKPKKPSKTNAQKHPIFTQIQEWGGTFEILADVVNTTPIVIPMSVTNSMKTLVTDKHVELYHNIFIYDLDGSAGVAAEVSFPIEDINKNYTPDNFINAINKIHDLCQTGRLVGKIYNTSAFSLRFVKESQAYMSMMQGYNCALIELDMLTATYADNEIFHRYEKAMYQFGGRPHWGLDYDVLTSQTMFQMYPKLDRWYRVYKMFNARGTFNGPFTERMGLSVHKFVSPLTEQKEE